MPQLSPESFASPPPKSGPVVPCHPQLRSDALRALAGAAREAEGNLRTLERRAQELGLDVFARRVVGLTTCLAEARDDLGRCPR
jgi:hypothetical protein